MKKYIICVSIFYTFLLGGCGALFNNNPPITPHPDTTPIATISATPTQTPTNIPTPIAQGPKEFSLVNNTTYSLADGVFPDIAGDANKVKICYLSGKKVTILTMETFSGKLLDKKEINVNSQSPVKYFLPKISVDNVLFRNIASFGGSVVSQIKTENDLISEGDFETYDITQNFIVLGGNDPLGGFFYSKSGNSWVGPTKIENRALYPFSLKEYNGQAVMFERNTVRVFPNGKTLTFKPVGKTSYDIVGFVVKGDTIFGVSHLWTKTGDSWAPSGKIEIMFANLKSDKDLMHQYLMTSDTSGLKNNTSLMPQLFVIENQLYFVVSIKNIAKIYKVKDNFSLEEIKTINNCGQPIVFSFGNNVWLVSLQGIYYGRL